MKTWIIVLVALLSVVGCNSREQAKEKSVAPDQALVKQAAAKLMQQGVQFLNQKDISKAVVSFQGAIQVDPTDLQPYMVLSEIFLSLKSYLEAIAVLERAANTFPDNGYVFYMLSLANESNGAALPAVLAARRSAELFQAQNNQEGFQQSVLLMQRLIKNEEEKESKQAPQTQQQKTLSDPSGH